jgi:threonine/homoserine/homoserine lactone efflux protein
MMSAETYFAYLIACIVLISIPGPNVTLTIANSLRYGTRAGLTTIFGTACGTTLMLVGLNIGMAPVLAFAAEWFWLLKLLGASYLLWLGIKMLFSKGMPGINSDDASTDKNYFMQGFLVLVGNPKMLLFLGAFVPQFIDMSADVFGQLFLMSVTLLVVTVTIDGLYAVLAGRIGHKLSERRSQIINRIGGSFMIGGGLWLALARK